MLYTESQFIRMTRQDKAQLLKIAELEERTPSDVIRRLIREAARKMKQADLVATELTGERDHGTADSKCN